MDAALGSIAPVRRGNVTKELVLKLPTCSDLHLFELVTSLNWLGLKMTSLHILHRAADLEVADFCVLPH
jgi:hypothetical protein